MCELLKKHQYAVKILAEVYKWKKSLKFIMIYYHLICKF